MGSIDHVFDLNLVMKKRKIQLKKMVYCFKKLKNLLGELKAF